MGKISIRLNAHKEKALDFLWDLKFIEKFEAREKKGKVRFLSAEQILGKLK